VDANGEEVELETCPLPKIPDWWPRLLQQFSLYENGNLLRPGGVAAQPRRYLRLMAYIQRVKAELLERRRSREAAAKQAV